MENLTSIKHTTTISDNDFDQYIADGWKLLHVYSQTTDDKVHVFFVMGHEGPLPTKPPKSFIG